MLFKSKFLDSIKRRTTTRTYRRWKQPQVKVGGISHLYRIGAIEVTSMATVPFHRIRRADAQLAGFSTTAALKTYLDSVSKSGDLYCVDFEFLGPIEKSTPAQSTIIDREQWQKIADKLARKDKGSPVGPWTTRTLTLIGESPGIASAVLCKTLDREQMALEKDIRKLKQLGFTISLETGYRLSDRGTSYLAMSEQFSPTAP